MGLTIGLLNSTIAKSNDVDSRVVEQGFLPLVCVIWLKEGLPQVRYKFFLCFLRGMKQFTPLWRLSSSSSSSSFFFFLFFLCLLENHFWFNQYFQLGQTLENEKEYFWEKHFYANANAALMWSLIFPYHIMPCTL